jgi:hypothetical protein
MKIELEIYLDTRSILSSADKWTQGRDARTKDGSNIDWRSLEACSFCLRGALNKAVGGVSDDAYLPLICRVINNKIEDYNCGVVLYNDTHTYEQVIEVLDEAIALAQGTA